MKQASSAKQIFQLSLLFMLQDVALLWETGSDVETMRGSIAVGTENSCRRTRPQGCDLHSTPPSDMTANCLVDDDMNRKLVV